MLFPSPVFLFIFLPIVICFYFLIPAKYLTARNYFLLISSLLFYAWGEKTFVFVMILVVLFNYCCGLWADHVIKQLDHKWWNGKRILLIVTVAGNIGFLFYYKYLNFTLENLKLLGLFDEQIRNIVLPIGISFFTFQAMSYVFDICMGRAKVQKNPFNVLLYVSFFPQLIAGPIVRYETVAAELIQRKENFEDFAEGIKRFIIGLGKKSIIANSIAPTADLCFNQVGSTDFNFYVAWIGAIAYTLQIYFGFSGYSDMAIGLGRMFGFHFEENFKYPYISKSISEFWRRWHISMGTWFRDYLYFPLGGSRVSSTLKLLRNLFVVWLVTGIWHGANWTFIVWGLWHLLWITFEKLLFFPKFQNNKYINKFYYFLTLIIVIIGWVIFRSENLSIAYEYLTVMFIPFNHSFGNALEWTSATSFLLKDCLFIILIAIVFSHPFIFSQFKNKLPKFIQFAIYFAIFFLSVSFSLTSTYDPFIYFNF